MKRSLLFGIIAIVAILFILGIFVWHTRQDTATGRAPIVVQGPQLFPFHRALDGTGVETEIDAMRRPVAIMIDNSSDARPWVGVERASLVYETIAEGSITRLLAIFDPHNLPKKIGPVRSLRPYYLSWADEVDAITTHVGGSPAALEQARSKDTINEFFAGQFFWRDEKRHAPHNTFTSGDLLTEAIELYEYATTTDIVSWEYATSTPAKVTPATNITVDFSLDPYTVQWIYNPTVKKYTRLVDGTLELATASNVVVVVMEARVLDSELRREVGVIGSGEAFIFREGKAVFGIWERENGVRMQFVDSDSKKIPLTPGTTWIEVIDDEGRLSFN